MIRAKTTQKKTLEKFIRERSDMTDDPLIFTLEKCRSANTPCARYIRTLEEYNEDDEERTLVQRIRTSERTKYRTYCNEMNQDLKRHAMYSDLSSNNTRD
eukprot:GHVO01036138.1.p3 GENE.GHVO01036138.1~~GHVO01036138.1.p3  ORF type:complete len:100 (+),score=17.21 GHVO01036138.1:642-941(+)